MKAHSRPSGPPSIPLGISGHRLYGTADHDELSLERLAAAVDTLGAAYHSRRFERLALDAPPLVHSEHHHVTLTEGAQRVEALRIRADVLNITARYLIQVREHDLAMRAIEDSLQDALSINDMYLAGAAVSVQA